MFGFSCQGGVVGKLRLGILWDGYSHSFSKWEHSDSVDDGLEDIYFEGSFFGVDDEFDFFRLVS